MEEGGGDNEGRRREREEENEEDARSSERLNRIYRGEGKLEEREGCGSDTISSAHRPVAPLLRILINNNHNNRLFLTKQHTQNHISSEFPEYSIGDALDKSNVYFILSSCFPPTLSLFFSPGPVRLEPRFYAQCP